MTMPEQCRKTVMNTPPRSIDLVKTVRAMITATLIVGSTYVHHVASTQPSGSKQADLQRSGSLGIELAMYIIENGKPLLNWRVEEPFANKACVRFGVDHCSQRLTLLNNP